MTSRRILRVNQLLREVLSEVIRKEIKHHEISPFVTITQVETSNDLHYAKVYISIADGSKEALEKALSSFQYLAGFIAVRASKKVNLHFFPELRFFHDKSIDNYFHLESIFKKIEDQKKKDSPPLDAEPNSQ